MAQGEQRIELPPLQAGTILNWPDVNPATIVHVFDARTNLYRDHPAYGRGFMGVRENGNIDVFWHRWQRQPNGVYRSVLSHHGGKDGFGDIEIAIRQCRRIIRGYVGIEEEIEPTDDLTKQEMRPPVTLREFADILGEAQTVFIPGHQEWAREIKGTIDQATREIVSGPGFLRVRGSLKILQNLRTRLDFSINPFLKETGNDIEEALLSDDRFKKLTALQKGGQRILERMQQIDNMVISVMQRHNRLEAHRSSAEENVKILQRMVVGVQGRWATVSLDQQSKLANELFAYSRLYLEGFITNPFKERSKRFNQLKDLNDILSEGGSDRVARVIKEAAIGLSDWRDEVVELQKGRFVDRYPLREV